MQNKVKRGTGAPPRPYSPVADSIPSSDVLSGGRPSAAARRKQHLHHLLVEEPPKAIACNIDQNWVLATDQKVFAVAFTATVWNP